MDFVAYYRVSTSRQGSSGLGLDAQRQAVAGYVNGNGSKLLTEVTEVESGKRNDRPELAKALALCKKHGATLVIAKLDRLARNVHFISGLMESGVTFIAADMPQANELTIHIMAAMAQFEAKQISRRTKEALAQAKARGVKLGGTRPNFRNHSRIRESAEFREKIGAIIRTLPKMNMREIAEELNRRGVQTFSGGEWGVSSVQKVLK